MMRGMSWLGIFLIAGTGASVAAGQQTSQAQQQISVTNRTLVVEAGARVSAAPDLAVIHVGFETQQGDAKQVYADGSRISNAIVAALKAAGIPASEIRSESQSLGHDWDKPRKFKLTERWTVRAPADRAAEILDVAIQAGATTSGEIEWTLKDAKTLDGRALEEATARVRENAQALAKGMGVKLGQLVYVTNEMQAREASAPRNHALMAFKSAAVAQPLAIEPEKMTSEAHVYAIFAIE